mgnify:FL=1
MGRKILITGAAGFIGFHLCKKLLQENEEIIGLDNMNSYYDLNLKKGRLKELYKYNNEKKKSLYFIEGDLINKEIIKRIFREYEPKLIIHLAAQAGVRYSITNPEAYLKSNLEGFLNIIEVCRNKDIENFIYASSSSVYGGNKRTPFNELDSVDHPVSFYAATKRSNELIAHTYSHLYNIPTTGLRFFTVYGPWGRPDMAPMIFTKAIFEKKPIEIFNNGNMIRDFTYIDDVINAIIRLIHKPAIIDEEFDKLNPNPSTSWAPYRIFNIGNQESIPLMNFIEILENEIGIKAIKNFKEFQKGDVQSTFASIKLLEKWTGFKPYTPINIGIRKFIDWYKSYYHLV